jgi:hypothetical protein
MPRHTYPINFWLSLQGWNSLSENNKQQYCHNGYIQNNGYSLVTTHTRFFWVLYGTNQRKYILWKQDQSV